VLFRMKKGFYGRVICHVFCCNSGFVFGFVELKDTFD
jgi:hypothetical protein